MKFLPKLVGFIVLLILVALSLLDGSTLNLSTKWVPFLGRFHPVLLHLPIGLFAGVVLLEVYLMVRPVSRVPEKIHFLLTAAFYTTVVSALFGIFLSWEGGYERDALNFHKWGGVATAGAILVLDWLLKSRRAHPERLPTAYLAGLVVTIGVMSITGHQGGSLTHGSDFLTQYNPFAKKAEVVEITADTPVFVSHIQPILKDYCVQCHSPEKIKGELRMDTYEMLMAGGVNGEALVPGDSEASSLIRRIHLPLAEEEHMPPKGKPQPSEEVVQLLSWWIDQGASDTARLEDLEVTSEVAVHFLEIEELEFQSREAVEERMEPLAAQSAVSVYFLAQDDHRVGARGNKATDADLERLLPLKANVVELNLSRSEVTDAGLEWVGQMTNLTHLHLNNTGVTDAGLEHLGNLYQLEYINLYGTNISDEGLQTLRRLKNLRKVFLWETQVTKEAVAALHQSVFAAVESDKLRMQIQELTKKRDNLEVDIVSAFDFGLMALDEVKPVETAKSGISISHVMINFHKGDDSIAARAREGMASKDDLSRMLENYRALLELTPPEGTLENWKSKTTELIDATVNLLEEDPDAVNAYKAAVNCKACHSEHRSD